MDPKVKRRRLQFLLAGKGTKSVKALAGSTKTIGKCVAKAVKKVRTKLKGACTMTVLSGPKAAAKKAAKALPAVR